MALLRRWHDVVRLLLAMLLIACSVQIAFAAEMRVGDHLPAVTVSDWQGRKLSLTDLRGKVIIVDFWASWCQACGALLPELDALNRRYASAGLVVAAISIDAQQSNAERFLARHLPEAEMTLLRDPDGALLSRFGAPGMPALYVVDEHGIVQLVQAGYTPQESKTIEALVSRMLADASTMDKGGRNDDTEDQRGTVDARR